MTAAPHEPGEHCVRSRIVVLGGTFDPVHDGHVGLLRGAVALLDAAYGVLVVEHGHRHREAAVASLDDRRRLAQLATADDDRLFEAGRLGVGGGLVEAVSHLAARGGEVHVVFGSDSARHLDRWNAGDLLAAATLWSVARDGDEGEPTGRVGRLALTVPPVAATRIRSSLTAGCRDLAGVPVSCRSEVERLYRVSPTPARADRQDEALSRA